MLIGLVVGLALAFATDISLPLVQVTKAQPNGFRVPWKEDVLFVVFGVLVSCATVYVLEVLRGAGGDRNTSRDGSQS